MIKFFKKQNYEKILKYMGFFKLKDIPNEYGTILLSRQKQQADALLSMHSRSSWKQIVSQFDKEQLQDVMSMLQLDMKNRDEDFEQYPHKLLSLMQEISKGIG